MKPIQKDELFDHLSEFLKTKGIELKTGSYSKTIQAGCSLLADAVNLSQAGIVKAKAGIDKKLDEVRQVIHEKTAPKSATRPSFQEKPPIIPTATAATGSAVIKKATKGAKTKRKRRKGAPPTS
jgi:hypothetical protein